MSRSLRSAAVVLIIVGSLAMPAGALAAGGGSPKSLTCTGVVSGGTYTNLNVPAGQFCYLSNATILGNATGSRRGRTGRSAERRWATAPTC